MSVPHVQVRSETDGQGLNSLANHGILPRNGKGLTLPLLNAALLEGYNVGNDFSTTIGGVGLLSSPNPLAGSFDLDNLDLHNLIEHDSSLSRDDYYFGDNHSFNNGKWQEVLAFVKGGENFNITSAAKAKYHRLQEQTALNPTLTYTPLQFILSYGETSLYLSVMGDPITGVAPVSYVRSFFEQERLPYELGWTKPATQTNFLTLGAMVLKLNAANGEPVPEGLILTASTLKAAFSGLDPITGAVEKIL
ncbi:Putative uncharacterized protein [Taphrina deformans PYCC 5710]|uniref:Heme haloperoxidase family profile domain-containing protein n=1 Tax=Taphrina deformans (strain PYCC 5710 / ATCC 11124 / CBS 356.35 / IMI 108563 / JCM 9778 / NBRC 8474) TaxID=1097556 RepID=R4XCU3_TAPDE|nr:Putative uncharacterized protein [Taphrina deformans PYCC 5710]|eukprot:CCG82228.1 Putative uncharacterized protein [Taphrina deformans PYCC 5710]